MKTLLCLGIFLIGFTCNRPEVLTHSKGTKVFSLQQAAWLLGSWQATSNTLTLGEVWYKQNDSTYTASSYFYKGKDTLSREHIELRYHHQILQYVPTVNTQNEGKAVVFTASVFTNDSLVFQNLKHDYPQFIRYTKLAPDSVAAEISGTVKGQFKKQIFIMKRLP